MSGSLGTILDVVAPIAGGAIGSGLGELGADAFGSTGASFLTPSMLADIGGALGGAGAGALVNKNRGVGALTGGIEGLLTGPQITNWLGIPQDLNLGKVTPFLSSLFGGAGWGRGSVQAGPGGVSGVTAASLGGAGAGAGGGQAGGGGGGAGGAGAADVPGSAAAAGTALAPGQITSGAGAGAPGTAGSGLGLGGGGSVGQILSALGLAAAAGGMGGGGTASNMPEGGNLETLANQAMGNAGMANSLRSGRLPPGAEQYADQAYADAAAGIQSRYAAMGLSGSTMEAQDLAAAQARTEGMKFQMASDATQVGIQSMQLADTIYSQIADYQLQQDQQLQDALAAFASAASGGSINYSVGGQGGSLGLNQQAA
jgi:hypothetical protein